MGTAQSAFLHSVFDPSTFVNNLQWDPSFNNSKEILQEIINNKNNITSPLTAAKVGWFFGHFASTDEGRKMATTNEVYDVIINHCAKQSTSNLSSQNLGLAIGNICKNNNPDGQRLFSTSAAASVLIEALRHYAKFDESVANVGFAISVVCANNREGQRLFSRPETVSAVVSALRSHRTNPNVLFRLCSAITNICCNNNDGQLVFSTEDVAEVLIAPLQLQKNLYGFIEHVAEAIQRVCANNPAGQRLFSTRETVAAFTNALQKHAFLENSVQALFSAVFSICQENENGLNRFCSSKEFIDSLQVRAQTMISLNRFAVDKFVLSLRERMCAVLPLEIFDTATSPRSLHFEESFRNKACLEQIISGKNKITSHLVALKVSWFLSNFVSVEEGRKIATANEVYDVIIRHCGEFVSVCETAMNVIAAITNIATLSNPGGQRLFSTPQTVSFLLNALETHRTNADVRLRLCATITSICFNNPDGQRLFSTVRVVETFIGIVQDPRVADSAFDAINAICDESESGLQLFSSEGFLSALKSCKQRIAAASTKLKANDLLKTLEDFVIKFRHQQLALVVARHARELDDGKILMMPGAAPFGGAAVVVEETQVENADRNSSESERDSKIRALEEENRMMKERLKLAEDRLARLEKVLLLQQK